MFHIFSRHSSRQTVQILQIFSLIIEIGCAIIENACCLFVTKNLINSVSDTLMQAKKIINSLFNEYKAEYERSVKLLDPNHYLIRSKRLKIKA